MIRDRIIKPSQRIDFLVLRRFPAARPINLALSVKSGAIADTSKLQSSVEAYRAELSALTSEELDRLVADERRKEADEARAAAEKRERDAHYHRPEATADFDHWSKAAYWTLDEAIALSMGKAPERVQWGNVQGFLSYSPFADQYRRRRDLAARAVGAKQLYETVTPEFFLAWAKRMDFTIPAELTAAVEARGIQIQDWQSLYEGQKEAYEKHREMYESHVSDWKDVVRKRDEFIDKLKSEIRELEAAQQPERPLGTREQESLLKLVIGMAVGGYGYDPKAERSPQIPEIAGDLALAGISMSDDTVRKWLRAAAELLPPK